VTVWVLLPAYNERDAIQREISSLCNSVRTGTMRIIVVDDGSADDTAARAEKMSRSYPVEVLRHDRNRGLGHALRTGLGHIVREGRPQDAVITKDADGTHPASLVPDMLDRLDRGWDIVIASRYRRGARECGLTRRRILLSRIGNTIYALAEPVPGVRDYTCGFRAFRLAALRRAADLRPIVEMPGFGATAELLLKVASCGARACEVPLVLRYDRKVGPSKMKALQALHESVRLLWLKS
jgi:dolichol-phosphate mannosyltransferase